MFSSSFWLLLAVLTVPACPLGAPALCGFSDEAEEEDRPLEEALLIPAALPFSEELRLFEEAPATGKTFVQFWPPSAER